MAASKYDVARKLSLVLLGMKFRSGDVKMLNIINRYCHGYTAISSFLLLKEKDFFNLIESSNFIEFDNVKENLGANKGHLLVVLRMLESLNWVKKISLNRYLAGDKIALHGLLDDFPRDLYSLDFPMDVYKKDELICLSIDKSCDQWGIGDEWFSDFFDGPFMLPFLLAIRQSASYSNEKKIITNGEFSSEIWRKTQQLFQVKGWGKETAENKIALSDAGAYLLDRMFIAGTVYSYSPMHLKMSDLLLGKASSVFSRDEDNHEGHVNRTLNVVASGFQHEKYFKDAESIILSIFDRQPLSDQPRYVADMGCGDGTLLKRVYQTVVNKTLRGKLLDEYPLTMIGVDFNEKALEATAATLSDMDHIVLKGDIGDPEQMERDLQNHVSRIEDILHIRSFLDHDRPFIPPAKSHQVSLRAELSYAGVYVDAEGGAIEPSIAVQSLVEHFERWSNIKSRFGLIVLEVHCLGADAAGEYKDESESLHFDAYHGFSKQYLVAADDFVLSAAEAGLMPSIDSSIAYPKALSFARITLNYLRKSHLKARLARISDIDTLRHLEEYTPLELRSDKDEIRKRIMDFEKGQIVFVLGEEIVGVIYTHRKGKGRSIDIVGCTFDPRVYEPEQYIDFVSYWSSLKDGVDSVSGAEHCKASLQRQVLEKPAVGGASEVVHHLRHYINVNPMKRKKDTVHAEKVLEEFGSRWLLSVFQSLGVFRFEGEKHPVDGLCSRLNILPKYERLFFSLLGILEKFGILKVEQKHVVVLTSVTGYALKDINRELADFETEYCRCFESFMPFLILMKTTLLEYANVLTGSVEATDVVFPEGSMDLFSGIFKGNAVADHFNKLMAEAVWSRVACKSDTLHPRRYRILEIGAGTGGASEFIFKRLGRTIKNVEYFYTDISSSFTRYGERRFGADYPWVSYRRLNIEESIEKQGFESNTFDIVIASNVLHDTEIIDDTLNTVKKLLNDDGCVILNEFTVMKDLLLYTGGLLHGWWLFRDPEYRQKNSCLLSVAQWKAAFSRVGLNQFEAFGLPFESDPSIFRQSVMLSSYDPQDKVEKERCQELSSIDQLSLGSSASVLSVIEKIQGALRDIIGAERMSSYSADTPLMELGIDSIELVELRAIVNKRLSIELDTTNFFQYNTVDKLSNYIIERKLPQSKKIISVNANVETENYIHKSLNKIIGESRLKKFSHHIPLMEQGLDSIELVELRALINSEFNLGIETSFFFQYGTIEKINRYIKNNHFSEGGKKNSEKDSKKYNEIFISTKLKERSSGPSENNKETDESENSPLNDIFKKIIGEDRIKSFKRNIPLMEQGLDSIEMVELRALINRNFDTDIKTSFFFQYNTIEKISRYFIDNTAAACELNRGHDRQENTREKEYSDKDLEGKTNPSLDQDIAIVGTALQFPGEVETLSQFSSFLQKGESAIRSMSAERMSQLGDISSLLDKPHLTTGGYLSSIDGFDADFFRLSRKEAEMMDPQQRILLELSWRAIEDAGYKASALRGSEVGVFIGACHFDYRERLLQSDTGSQAYVSTGTNGAVLANRISYFYDFTGPSVLIDTACSSSLVALHEAIKCLRKAECSAALVGGVNLIGSAANSLIYNNAGILSKTAECRTFDKAANGYVRGEGAGILLLKPLAQAKRDGDDIYAVIKGSAVNHGGQSSSLTAPNPDAQAKLIERAIVDAGIGADTIGYVEAHGTGTRLGDPIEIRGLSEGFSNGIKENTTSSSTKSHCVVGSVKPSIGHLEGASGIAGLFKVVCCLRDKVIPVSANFEHLNPEINIDNPFVSLSIAEKTRDWFAPHKDQQRHYPRRAGVSAFGFGGANAHVILEEYESLTEEKLVDGSFPYNIFVFSAKSEESIKKGLLNFHQYLSFEADNSESNHSESHHALDRICFTLQEGREHMPFRFSTVISSSEQLCDNITDYLSNSGKPSSQYLSSTAWNYANEKDRRPSDETHHMVDSRKLDHLQDLASLWASGANIHWLSLYSNKPPLRIHLPSYQFDHESYWIPESPVTDVQGYSNGIGLKPRSEELINFIGQIPTYLSVINVHTADYFLSDHVVGGRKVLPAAAQIEFVRMYIESLTGEHLVELSDFFWLKPISPEKKESNLKISLSLAGERSRPIEEGVFEENIILECKENICSKTKASTAKVAKSKEFKEKCFDLALLKQHMTNVVDGVEIYDAFDKATISYGKTFKSISKCYLSARSCLSRIQPPKVISEIASKSTNTGHNAQGFMLNPAVFDAVLQSAEALLLKDLLEISGGFIPYSAEKILFGSFEELGSYSELYSYARYSQVVDDAKKEVNSEGLEDKNNNFYVLDIDLLDAKGKSLVSFVSLQFVSIVRDKPRHKKLLDAEMGETLQGEVYAETAWRRSELKIDEVSKNQIAGGGPHVLMLDRSLSGVKKHLKKRAPNLNIVDVDLPVLGSPSYFHGAEENSYIDFYMGFFEQIKELFSKESCNVYLAYCGERDNPIVEGISGAFKSLSKEFSSSLTKTIGLSHNSKIGDYAPVDILLNEIYENRNTDAVVFYDEKWIREHRYLKEIENFDNSSIVELAVPQGGVYWVLGGLGGVGLAIAKHLMKTRDAHVIVSGRREYDAQVEEKLQYIRDSTGKNSKDYRGRISYLCCDVATQQSVDDTIKNISASYGDIRGVIHCAGIVNDAMLINKASNDFKAVLLPKVQGVLILDEATKNLPLEFFVTFSSIVALTGNVGQIDYSTAGGFIDGFAKYRQGLVHKKLRRGKTLSINWPLWEEGGMGKLPSVRRRLRNELGLTPMPTSVATDVLDRYLTNNKPQVILGYGNREKIREVLFKKQRKQKDTPESKIHEHKKAPSLSSINMAQETISYLKQKLASTLKRDSGSLDENVGLDQYGIDSIMAMELTDVLEKDFGNLPKTLFFEYLTLSELSQYFGREHRERVEALFAASNQHGVNTLTQASDSTPDINDHAATQYHMSDGYECRINDAEEKSNPSDIAIIGMSGRYPKAKNLNEYWQNLVDGLDCVEKVPEDRWTDKAYGKEKIRSSFGGFLSDIDIFDPLFFKISPREAERMDPQERLFLEVVWETLEDSGYTPESLDSSDGEMMGGRVGVYVGVMYNEYQLYGAEQTLQGNTLSLSGNAANVANRISYFCNFNGPSMAIDTMCSSSLTAIHLAAESLISGSCKVAIAGGVNLSLHPNKFIMLDQGKFSSTTGRCGSFGEGGDGYVPGEGVGAILLKPLKDAERDGDNIYAVIKGTGINHGGKANGYTVPRPQTQAAAVKSALEKAKIDPRHVSYIEAHGTGTALGDPIEIAGLNSVFPCSESDKQYCAIGSAKSNIGHCESAAGIAGLTKVVLQMKHQTLVPSIHSSVTNPNIDFSRSAFYVQQNITPWQRPVIDGLEAPRIAGLSSFGAGGSNSHILLQEYSKGNQPAVHTSAFSILPFSSKSEELLKEYVERFSRFLSDRSEGPKNASLDSISERMTRDIKALVSEVSKRDITTINSGSSLGCYRLDLHTMADLKDKINNQYKVSLNLDAFFSDQNIEGLVDELAQEYQKEIADYYAEKKNHSEELNKYIIEPQNKGQACAGNQVYDLDLSDIAFTLQTGRVQHGHRVVFIAESIDELRRHLRCYCQGKTSENIRASTDSESDSRAFDKEVKEYLDGIEYPLSEGGALKLAGLWASGATINWNQLYHNTLRRRVSLPPAPFSKVKCWPVSTNNEELIVQHAATNYLHPLVHRNASGFDHFRMASVFDGKEFFFEEHVVDEKKIFPGVCFLEAIIFSANTLGSGDGVVRLDNVDWIKPLVFEGRKSTMDIVFRKTSHPSIDFNITQSSLSSAAPLVQGQIKFEKNSRAPEALDLIAIENRCQSILKHKDLYEELSAMGFSYGDNFRCVKNIRVGNNEAIAEIEPIKSPLDGIDDYFLHPGLVDGVFQSTFGIFSSIMSRDEKVYVPISLTSAIFYRSVNESCRAYVRLCQPKRTVNDDGVQEVDIDILSREGEVLAEVRGMLFSPLMGSKSRGKNKKDTASEKNRFDEVDNSTEKTLEKQLCHFSPVWQHTPIGDENVSREMGIDALILGQDEGFSDKLVGQWRNDIDFNSISKIDAEILSNAEKISGENTSQAQSVVDTWLYKNTGKIKTIVLFEESDANDISNLKASQLPTNVLFLVQLCQTILSRESIPKIKILYVRRKRGGLDLATGSAIHAFLRVLAIENSIIDCASVLIEDKKTHDIFTHASKNIKKELLNKVFQDGGVRGKEVGEVHIDFEMQRHVRYFKKIDSQEVEEISRRSSQFRKNGTYLISGGLGGIAMQVAEYLCRQYSANIVLFGRSELSQEKETLLEQVQGDGSVVYRQADVCRFDDVVALLQFMEGEYGHCNGILHCAGVAKTTLIKKKDLTQASSILPPKIQGIINLDEASKDKFLDLFITFSSISSVVGDAGLSDYAYANGFMDGYIEQRSALVSQGLRRGVSLSINWPYWKQGGMQVNRQTQELMSNNTGMMPLDSSLGIESLELSLKSDKSQWLVAFGDEEKISRLVSGGNHHVKEEAQKIIPSISSNREQALHKAVAEKELIDLISDLLKISDSDILPKTEWENFGFDSVTLTEFAGAINTLWDLNITPAVFFEFHCVEALASHLASGFYDNLRARNIGGEDVRGENLSGKDKGVDETVDHSYSKNRHPLGNTAEVKRGAIDSSVKAMERSFPGYRNQNNTDDIAVIGMSATMPQSENLRDFWEGLMARKNFVTEVPKHRWEMGQHFGDPEENGRKTNSRWGGFIWDVDKFDPLLFGISPSEARYLDPQHRHFLQTVWHCLEDSGYAPSSFAAKKIGVFVGAQFSDYQALIDQSGIPLNAHVATGNAHSMLPNRISYLLDLRGPSEAIDTACSSSLVAIHRAINAIRLGECEQAIAGGVSLALAPLTNILAAQMGALSSEGQCKTFAKDADGYVKGEGIGAILLKPLAQAKLDGDAIHGVIKASEVSHGGKAKSLTAPNPGAQAELIASVYRRANIHPKSVGYIETHGTGTELGDPIEVEGLKAAFNKLYKDFSLDVENPHIALGALKANIGHLEPAAGIAGVIKVLLSLKNKVIPPNIGMNEQNPYIHLAKTPFYIAEKSVDWKAYLGQDGERYPRRAGISSFGFGGTNAHLIVEESPGYESSLEIKQAQKVSTHLVPLSARTMSSLQKYSHSLSDDLARLDKHLTLADIAHTLQTGRNEFDVRALCITSSIPQLIDQLSAISEGGICDGVFVSDNGNSKTESGGKQSSQRELRDEEAPNLLLEENYIRISQEWVNGREINWRLLSDRKGIDEGNAVYRPKKCHLPGYVFAKEQYWFEERSELSTDKRDRRPAATDSKHSREFKREKYNSSEPISKATFTEKTIDRYPSSEDAENLVYYEYLWVEDKEKISTGQKEQWIDKKATLVFCNSESVADELSRLENRWGGEHYVVSVDSRQDFSGCSEDKGHRNRFLVSDYERKSISQLFDKLKSLKINPQRFLLLLDNVKFNTKKVIKNDLAKYLNLVIGLYQECKENRIEAVDIYAVANHKAGQFQPQHSALSSFLNTLRAEDPSTSVKYVEVLNESGENEETFESIINRVIYETHYSDDIEVRIAGSKRWLRKKRPDEKQKSAPDKNLTFRSGGTYVISGGAGEIGLVFARHLSLQYGANIVLIGRSNSSVLDGKGRQKVDQISSLGGTVQYIQCDVSSARETKKVVAGILKEFGKINGIIHAAGIIKDCLVRNKTPAIVEGILEAKVYGTINLDDASKRLDLDFFLVCSSLSAIKPNIGQSVYGYANGFMDTYCYMRKHLESIGVRKGRSIAINWPLWESGGMSVSDELSSDLVAILGHRALRNSEGIKTLEHCLGSDKVQLFPCLTTDDDSHGEGSKEGSSNKSPSIAAGDNGENSLVDSDVISLCSDYLRDIFENLLGHRLDDETLFEGAGLDSFMSIKAIKKIEEDFGSLRKTLLYEYTNIAALSKFLSAKDIEVAQRVSSSNTGQVREELSSKKNITLNTDETTSNRGDESRALKDYLKNLVAGVLDTDIGVGENFTDVGLDSFHSIKLVKEIEKTFGSLPKTLLYEYHTISKLAEYLEAHYKGKVMEIFSEINTDIPTKEEEKSPVATGPVEPFDKENSPVIEGEEQALDDGELLDIVGKITLVPQEWERQSESEREKIRRLSEIYGNECTLSQASYYMSPELLFLDGVDAFFHVCRYQRVLIIFGYSGKDGDYRALLHGAFCYASSQNLEINLLTEKKIVDTQFGRLTATPFGVMQRIHKLQSYSFEGRSFRRIRNSISRFVKSGRCEVLEYILKDDPKVDGEILCVIDEWCERKNFVNPYINKVREKICTGELSNGTRIFLTYVEGALKNVIFVTKISGEYFMDLEFYSHDMPHGGLEYAVSEIIKKLKEEGVSTFSLGATFGVEHGDLSLSDREVREKLEEMRVLSGSGKGNFQFKNKFGVTNTTIYLSKLPGGNADHVSDIYAVISGQHIFGSDFDYSSKPDRASESTEKATPSEKNSRLLEANGLNPMLVDDAGIDIELKTDSWAQLSYQAYISDELSLVKQIPCYSNFNKNSQGDNLGLLEGELGELFGMEDITVTASGRHSEELLLGHLRELFDRKESERKKIVLQNLLFPTWIFSELDNNFEPIEIPSDEVFNLHSESKYKGNIAVDKLRKFIDEKHQDVAFCCVELSNNAAGGYPVSIKNISQVKSILDEVGIPLVMDATRIIENAIFIQNNEPVYSSLEIKKIIKIMISYADYLTGSLGKDFLSPGGGFLGRREKNRQTDVEFPKWSGCEEELSYLVPALTQLSQFHYIEEKVVNRMALVERLWDRLRRGGVPVVSPSGVHCVTVDVSRIPNFEKMTAAAESFVSWLFGQTGIRCGVHSAGMQKNTSLNSLVRLAIPVGIDEKIVDKSADLILTALRSAALAREIVVSKPTSNIGNIHSEYRYKDELALAEDKILTEAFREVNGPSAKEDKNDSSSQNNVQKESTGSIYKDRSESRAEGVAIVGLAGRYPQAANIDEFWQNLVSGKDCITSIPESRKALCRRILGEDTVPSDGGYLDDVDRFDADFFDISEDEAKSMDPQERLFLEIAWSAIEDAGYTPSSLVSALGSNRIGVYVGVTWNQYHLLCTEHAPNYKGVKANPFHFSIANRVSFFLDFCGPSFAVDSACSSSFTALSLACQGLDSGSIDAAIVGAVNLDLHESKLLGLQASNMLSGSGRCHSFSENADGYVTGEGCGAVLLKRLNEAQTHGDHIYGVIRDTSINHAGTGGGYSIPNPKAQTNTISESLAQAKVSPASISYVEGHGTGTDLGDSIEILSLSNAFRASSVPTHSNVTALASVKSNIGHLESASGMASLTKVLLQFKYKKIVASLHVDRDNEMITSEGDLFYIPKNVEAWTQDNNLPRVACINAFAAGGTTAHIVVEESIDERLSEQRQGIGPESAYVIIPVSARTEEQLKVYLKSLSSYLTRCDASQLLDIAYTLQVGRVSMAVRCVFMVNSLDSAIREIESFLTKEGTQSDDPSSLDNKHPSKISSEIEPYDSLSGVDLNDIAKRWLAGETVDWSALYSESLSPRRISLPTYPFSNTKFWLDLPSDAVHTVEPALASEDISIDEVKNMIEGEVEKNIQSPKTHKKIIAPKNSVERKVTEIWCEVLGVESSVLSVEDNLFSLGGDSFLFSKISSQVKREFNVNLKLASLFNKPTITEMARQTQALIDKSRETVSKNKDINPSVGENVVYF